MTDIVWVRTTLDEQRRRYVVTLEADEDHAVHLDTATAHQWAGQILAAVATATHDSMIVAQLTAMGFSDRDVAGVLTPLRADRAATQPVSAVEHLTLTPGVSVFDGRPFLHVVLDGAVVGQWTLPDARDHAIVVLEALARADLDTAYLRALMSPTVVGLDYPHATAVVHGLSRYEP